MTGGYEEIGGLLRGAREEFGLTTYNVSEALHIRAIYLEALENGSFENLPGAAYARGYLLSYATYLQLDAQEILRRFEQVEQRLKRGFYLPQGIGREKKPSRNLVWGGLAGAAAAYLLWILAFQPYYGDISAVDNPFRKKRWVENGACFQAKTALYPPCHRVTQAALTWWPLKGQAKSIMDLADIK